jgi:hypothetical protein
MTYCEYITTITGDQLSLHKEYHDNHYAVREFLISTGYLPGAHSPQCPVYKRIRLLKRTK